MIKLLRNKEVRITFITMLLISLAASSVAFYFNLLSGFLILLLCAAFISIFLIFAYKKYREISEIAYDIDDMLHKDTFVDFEACSEGEIGILRSEIQKLTEKLREQKETLLKDKRYLSTSLADISHQIKTPLTSINLYVQFLSSPDLTEEQRLEVSRSLYQMLSRIEGLITALLKISRLDARTVEFKKEKTALISFTEKAAEPLAVPLEIRNQQLEIKGGGFGYFDVLWTGEALLNILKNCMEHTPDGKKLIVSVEENPIYSQISVEDEGEGISDEDLPHLFERFYKGKSSDDKNFGIGLNLARSIITEQNGTVKAENREEGGARFVIKFYKETV